MFALQLIKTNLDKSFNVYHSRALILRYVSKRFFYNVRSKVVVLEFINEWIKVITIDYKASFTTF